MTYLSKWPESFVGKERYSFAQVALQTTFGLLNDGLSLRSRRVSAWPTYGLRTWQGRR
jgi:hypothetical protein